MYEYLRSLCYCAVVEFGCYGGWNCLCKAIRMGWCGERILIIVFLMPSTSSGEKMRDHHDHDHDHDSDEQKKIDEARMALQTRGSSDSRRG